MKAIATTDFGAPVTLVEISTPEPGEGEILVRVASSSINGFDLSVASGRLKGMMEHRFPVVLGKDFAGTVESTGAGVDGFAEGDTVFGVVMKPELGDGSFGERVATPAAFAAKVPDGVDAATAGALGVAGTAAHDAVEAVELQQGETVRRQLVGEDKRHRCRNRGLLFISLPLAPMGWRLWAGGWWREVAVATTVPVAMGDGEVAAAVAGGVDEAFVDEAGAGGAELFGAAAHDGGDVAGGVFAGAEFSHCA